MNLSFNDQINIFELIVTILQYITLWFICIILLFLIPMIFFLHNPLNEFRDLFEPYHLRDFKLLEKNFQKYDNRLQLSFNKERNKVILSYFKTIILVNTGMYSEALEILNSYINLTLKSMAFKYEFFNLMGQIYTLQNEKEKAKEMISTSIEGFKKIHFFAPISPLELYFETI